MFLAWKEIWYSKGRYSLIIGIIFLISYLVFFLTGLAYGLAQDGRLAADKWEATGIILSKESDNNLNLSQFSDQDFKDVSATNKAILLQKASIAQLQEKPHTKANVSLFGINRQQFIAPNITKGEMFKNDHEVVISNRLAKQSHFKLHNKFKLTGSNEVFTIVGMTNDAMFNVAPVIYMSQAAFNNVFGTTNSPNINAIVVRDKDHKLNNIKIKNDKLEAYTMPAFINNLPGYSAQVMTFELMIGSLIIISAVILGIFIYILTIQKKHIFGVMKVQGISSGFIAKSVIMQTFILSLIGVLLGACLTMITQMFLPAAMPFNMNSFFYISISLLMVIFAVAGSLFSIRSIVKIDPLDALS